MKYNLPHHMILFCRASFRPIEMNWPNPTTPSPPGPAWPSGGVSPSQPDVLIVHPNPSASLQSSEAIHIPRPSSNHPDCRYVRPRTALLLKSGQKWAFWVLIRWVHFFKRLLRPHQWHNFKKINRCQIKDMDIIFPLIPHRLVGKGLDTTT